MCESLSCAVYLDALKVRLLCYRSKMMCQTWIVNGMCPSGLNIHVEVFLLHYSSGWFWKLTLAGMRHERHLMCVWRCLMSVLFDLTSCEHVSKGAVEVTSQNCFLGHTAWYSSFLCFFVLHISLSVSSREGDQFNHSSGSVGSLRVNF